MTAQKTQPTSALNADNFASDSERKQNRRLMIASSISVAVNLMFLIGAARGMEESPFRMTPDVRNAAPEKRDRDSDAFIRIEVRIAPTPAPAATPTPPKVARVEPENPEPKPRQTPPPTRPVERVPLPRIEPTPRVVTQPTSPVPIPPDVREIPDDEPITTPIKPVEEPLANAPEEAPESVQARAVRVIETTAGGRMTGASVATSAVPAARGAVSVGSDARPVAPSVADGTISLTTVARTFRANVTEGVADAADNLPAPQSEAGGANSAMVAIRVRGIGKDSNTPGSVAPRVSGPGGAVGDGGNDSAKIRGAGGAPDLSGIDRTGIRPVVRPVSGGGSPVANRPSGIDAGSGSDTRAGLIKNVGNGKDADITGTGTATSTGRATIAIEAGGGGADIISSKPRFRDGNNDMIQIDRDKALRTTRPVSAPRTERLSDKIDKQNVESLVAASVLSRKRPVLTEDMKATNPRKVTAEFTVGADGSASYRIVASSGNAEVDAAVLKACAAYRWRAASKGGVPVPSSQRVTFDPGE